MDRVTAKVNQVETLLDAGVHGACGRSRVRGLCVDVVGFDQGRVPIGGLIGQNVLFAQLAHLLTNEKAGRVVGADTVAVRNQNDDVLGAAGVRLACDQGIDVRLTGGEPFAGCLRQVLGESRKRGSDGRDGCESLFHWGMAPSWSMCRPPIRAFRLGKFTIL